METNEMPTVDKKAEHRAKFQAKMSGEDKIVLKATAQSKEEQTDSDESDNYVVGSVYSDTGRPQRVKPSPDLGFSITELHEQILMNAVLLFQPTVDEHTTWRISKGYDPLPLTNAFNIAIFTVRLLPPPSAVAYQAVLTNAIYGLLSPDKPKTFPASRLTSRAASNTAGGTQPQNPKMIQTARLARGNASATAKGALEELLVTTAGALTSCEGTYVRRPPRRRPGSWWVYGYPTNEPDDEE